ncbi:hypothetical protein [Aquipuribacter nitratireducens]|uniref:DUF3618 domain-containing protein n=2 Tax=Aquipuribacter nitratireducens TaxID=650104 RepID=A0ABW0GK85_9MICO
MGERADALAWKSDVPARSREKVHDVTDRIKEKVSEMTHTASSTMSDARGAAGERAHSAGDRAHEARERVGDGAHRAKGMAESNPIGLALGAVAAGFIAGLLVPVSRFEHEHLGQAADTLREKASDMGQEVTDRARNAAHAAEDAAKEEMSSSS